MSPWRRKALKTTLQLLCQLLWVLGLVVGLSGVYLLMKYRQSSIFFSDTYIILPAVFSLVSAVFLVASGCLGSWLSLRDSTFLQGLVGLCVWLCICASAFGLHAVTCFPLQFLYLLVLVFCLESTASALAYFHSTKLDAETAPLGRVFQEYTGSSQDPGSRAVDITQEDLQCCGVHDYKDWLKTPWFNRTGGHLIPHSCCNTTFPSCNGTVDQSWKLYTQGCKVKLDMAIQLVLSFIIWGSAVVFLVEVFLFLIMAQLMMDPPFMEYQVLDKK